MILESLHSPRTLPHSEESERALLAAVLLDAATCLRQVADRLGPEDFYFERHQVIFAAMLELGADVDLRTLQAHLQQRGKLDQVGGLAYLASLDVDLPDIGRLDRYVGIVRDCSLRRRLVQAGSALVRSALDGSELDGAGALALAEVELRGLAARSLPATSTLFGQVLEETLERLEDGDRRTFLGTSTGWPDVDRVILGLRPGNLLIVGGGPGAGKTTWASQVATHLAAQQGIAVGIFSLEMTGFELVLRTLCEQADISHHRLVNGYLSAKQWQTLVGTARRLSGIPLHIDDDSTVTLQRLLARARRWRAEHDVGLIVIDHLQLMSAEGRWGTRNEELAACSRALKSLAKELEIPIVLLSQILISGRGGGDLRPQLSDLRDSKAPAQDADVVMFIYRDELHNPDNQETKGLAELIVRKNRNGAPETVQMVFVGETFSFRQLARDHTPTGSTEGWQKPREIFANP